MFIGFGGLWLPSTALITSERQLLPDLLEEHHEAGQAFSESPSSKEGSFLLIPISGLWASTFPPGPFPVGLKAAREMH